MKKEEKIELDDHQINYILEMFNDDYRSSIVCQEDIDQAQKDVDEEEEEYKGYRQRELDALVALKGFEIFGFTTDDHVNDGQMCTYDFTFTSPSGVNTHLSTDMCLMVGFNYHESFEVTIEESSETIREREEEAQRKDHEKQQKKKAKIGKSNSKWFDLIGDQLIDKSPEEMYDILKEYKFPNKHK